MKLFPIAMTMLLGIFIAFALLLTSSMHDPEVGLTVDKDDIELLFLSDYELPYYEYVTEDAKITPS